LDEYTYIALLQRRKRDEALKRGLKVDMENFVKGAREEGKLEGIDWLAYTSAVEHIPHSTGCFFPLIPPVVSEIPGRTIYTPPFSRAIHRRQTKEQRREAVHCCETYLGKPWNSYRRYLPLEE